MICSTASRLTPLLLLALGACWVPLEQGQLMESRLDKLEADAADQARRLQEQERLVRDRVAQVDRKIVEVQSKIDELNLAARRSGADLGVQVQRLQEELTRARGDLEAEQHNLKLLQQSLAELDARTEKRFLALRGRGALEEAEAKEKIQGLARADDRPAFLALARQEESAGNTGVAREIYDDYVRRFPNDPSAAEAALRSGELATGLKRWKEAFVAYGWVYKNAPQSPEAPDAMLGMANAMFELEDLKADAPAVLRELVKKYPKSKAAARAKARLSKSAPKQRAPAKKQP